jgi:hypothetical protein
MGDKAKLVQLADEAFSELREAIDGLPDEALGTAWLGTWGVREILVHISGWHREMVPAFERIARGEAPFPPGTYDDFDSWNARFVAAKAGASIADVRAELPASHAAFVRAAEAFPEESFAPGGAARELFDGAGPAHYREHTEQIRAWRAALS